MFTRNLTLAISMRAIGKPCAYAPGESKWKLDADGKIVLENGNPVYILDGNEMTLGADTVYRLSNEAKEHRVRADKAETTLKTFEGLDPAAARTALDTVSKIDQKKLIDAGEVDRVRTEIGKSFESQIAEKDKSIADLTGQLDALVIGGAFTGSKYVTDNIAVPPDMLQATFGKNFKREDGKLVAYDANGQKMYSPKRAGELADFDEAMSVLVEGYAHKDSILKGGNHRGTGNNGNGGQNGNGRVIRRAEWETWAPHKQKEAAEAMRKGELTIAD